MITVYETGCDSTTSMASVDGRFIEQGDTDLHTMVYI